MKVGFIILFIYYMISKNPSKNIKQLKRLNFSYKFLNIKFVNIKKKKFERIMITEAVTIYILDILLNTTNKENLLNQNQAFKIQLLLNFTTFKTHYVDSVQLIDKNNKMNHLRTYTVGFIGSVWAVDIAVAFLIRTETSSVTLELISSARARTVTCNNNNNIKSCDWRNGSAAIEYLRQSNSSDPSSQSLVSSHLKDSWIHWPELQWNSLLAQAETIILFQRNVNIFTKWKTWKHNIYVSVTILTISAIRTIVFVTSVGAIDHIVTFGRFRNTHIVVASEKYMWIMI